MRASRLNVAQGFSPADAANRSPKGLRHIRYSACILAVAIAILDARSPEILQSTGGIPAHVAGRFRTPIGFQQSESGQYFDPTAFAVAPNSLFFGKNGRLLVTPGLYEFVP